MTGASGPGLTAEIEVRLGSLVLRVALSVGPGETVAVVGPNGAGKTTLLRALAGLQLPDAGRITLGDTVLDDVAGGVHVDPEDRSIAVVFQEHLLFPHLSALDNVAFGLRARGTRRADADAAARRWLERVGLAAFTSSRPGQLSGGQAQRVALARALVTSPDLLLLDEPLAALDASTRQDTRRELRRHLDAHGGARVLVTHDPIEAAALADRLVVIEGGAVVQEGTLAALTAHPRSRYVADLVGVNLLRGRAVDGRVAVGDADGGFELVLGDRVDGDVLVAIPPRAVTLAPTRPEGTARNVWPGVVDGIDHAGERARVRVRGPVTVVAEVTDASAQALGLVDGTQVWVAVKATEIQTSPA